VNRFIEINGYIIKPHNHAFPKYTTQL